LASIVTSTTETALTSFQLRILSIIRSEGGSLTGPQLEGECVKRLGLSSEEAMWRRSRSVFYSNLRALCEEGIVEKFELIHYIGMKVQVGYRLKEETGGS
jgi:hypothetical protein